nr:methyltransferase domain-containing protein [Deltaproteobacteria bacterium]
VYTVPFVRGIEGYDVPLAWGLRGMTVFKGPHDPEPALYIPATAPSQRPEAVLLRSRNGLDFEIVSEPGLGMKNPTPRSLRSIVPFKGRLFTAPAMGQEKGQTCTFGSAAIFVSDDPDQGDWKLANPPDFGNPNNVAVFTMIAFGNYLYAGTTNIQEGFELWRTEAEGKPPFRWERVLTRGAYRGKFNQIGGIVGNIGDYAYIGTGIQSGGHDRKFKVGPAAPEILRVAPDGSWDVVMGEPRQTPDGLKVPLSGMGPGFNRFHCGYIWYGQPHDGWLYVGTFDWGPYTFFAKLNEMPKQVSSNLQAFQSNLRRRGGFEMWRSADGVTWIPVTRNGFGKYMDVGIRTMKSTPYGLFVGILNDFGPEVAVPRLGGWRYERNPDCGLQIYLGRHDYPAAGRTSRPYDLRSTRPAEQIKTLAQRKTHKSSTLDDVIRHYYDGSDFRHVGFWTEDIGKARDACENLVDELTSFLPKETGRILDLCCGRGATTKHLVKSFSPNWMVGVTSDADDLPHCGRNAPGVRFECMRLPKLSFTSDTFEAVVCVEGFHHDKTRPKLLEETFRVLEPNGRLVFSDLLSPKRKSRTFKRGWHNGAGPRSLDDYRGLLEQIGYCEIALVETTAQCWERFSRDLHRYLQTLILAQRIDEDSAQKIASLLPGADGEISCYLVGCAVKPPLKI